jgi:nucleoid DNA-binding protein
MAGASDVAVAVGVHSSEVIRVFKSILAICKDGEKVTIQGFGTFQKKHKEACVKRNPATGAPVNVAAKDVLHFKASTNL